MPRIFILSRCVSKDTITLTDACELHHFKRVLRLRQGEPQVAVDEKGTVYHATVEKILPSALVLKIENKILKPNKKAYSLTVACALPKKVKMDDIIDKLTQLGTGRIIPLQTKRVAVKLDKDAQLKKLKRWEKIALNAAQQSQRDSVPIIEPLAAFEDVVDSSAPFEVKLIPALTDERRPLREVLAGTKPESIIVLIGPEGDFTPEEIHRAKGAGFIPVSLGKEVLRVDTAAVAVASFIKLYYEDD